MEVLSGALDSALRAEAVVCGADLHGAVIIPGWKMTKET